MNSRTRPTRLFRYFSPESSNFFAEKKLWFCALKELNDPFDALPRFDVMMEKQIQDGIRKEFAFLPPQVNCSYQPFENEMRRQSSDFLAEGIDAVSEKYRDVIDRDYRLVCFSENPDDMLMWGHYAKRHTGFVVEFNPVHQIFAGIDFEKVDYPDSNERARIEYEKQSSGELWKILFRKSNHWKYENEWRLVKLTASLPEAPGRDNKMRRYIELPPDSVLAVYLGWQIPQEESEKLIKSLKTPEWKGVNDKKFIMRPHKTRYALEPVSWDEWLNRPKEYKEELDRLIPPVN